MRAAVRRDAQRPNGRAQAIDTLCHAWAHAPAWNFSLDRLAKTPGLDPIEFERACHDEAACLHNREPTRPTTPDAWSPARSGQTAFSRRRSSRPRAAPTNASTPAKPAGSTSGTSVIVTEKISGDAVLSRRELVLGTLETIPPKM